MNNEMQLTGQQKKNYQREYMHLLRVMVPGEGLEPTSLLRAEDFKSSASANSATPAKAKHQFCIPSII
jgi:hypothetical protein